MPTTEDREKIMLVICEGPADLAAYKIFQIFTDRLNATDETKPIIQILYTKGDKLTYLTRNPDGTTTYYDKADCATAISSAIKEPLNHFCSSKKVSLQDFERVIFITDMDGVYIDDRNIQGPDMSEADPFYADEYIYTNHRNRIVGRNIRKRNNLEYLLEQSDIELETEEERRRLPLYLCYVSCNLDHVMVDERNNWEKVSPANTWKKKVAGYSGTENIYRYFSDLCPTIRNYNATWDWVSEKRTPRSLSRCSNAVLVLDWIDYYVKRHEKERTSV